MRRATLWLMIPLNLILLAWAWFGRLFFGVGGWFLLILLPAVAILLIAFIVTSVLALTQHGSPKALTGKQTAAQLALWVSLFGFGLFLPDFGDTEDSTASFLTQVFGDSDALIDAGLVIAAVFGVLILLSYVVLLVLLIFGRRKASPATT